VQLREEGIGRHAPRDEEMARRENRNSWDNLEGYLNGKLLLQYTLPEPASGKVGVWSKTDSVSYFNGYTVRPAE
jgi:hypothetical protein